MTRRVKIAALALAAAALSPGWVAASTTTEPSDDTTAAANTDAAGTGTMVAAIDDERCQANRDAGTITYLTGYDFAAAASVVEMQVAEAKGYYDELCLDVEIKPSFSTANYPLVAAGEAQFASAGSFSEMVAASRAQDTDFVALAVEGRTPIDVLIVKPGVGDVPEDLEGRTIGVKGALNSSVRVMLAEAGLIEGQDYETVLLDGFDPQAHIALDEIDAFPGYRSNEPGTLERAGTDFELIDPANYDVPGSFGVIYTSRSFLDEHPGPAVDFLRATMRGLADAIDDPEAAALVAMGNVEANGNPSHLSSEGEVFRWTTDAQTIAETTPDGVGYGLPDMALLQSELDAVTAVGLFSDDPAEPGDPPVAGDYLDIDLSSSLYSASGSVIWP